MTPANLLRDCSFEIAARGRARLASVQSQIPKGTVISIAFLAGDTVPILIQAAAYVRQLGFTPKPHISGAPPVVTRGTSPLARLATR